MMNSTVDTSPEVGAVVHKVNSNPPRINGCTVFLVMMAGVSTPSTVAVTLPPTPVNIACFSSPQKANSSISRVPACACKRKG